MAAGCIASRVLSRRISGYHRDRSAEHYRAVGTRAVTPLVQLDLYN